MANSKKSTTKAAKKQQANIPYHYKPGSLSLEEWQKALRRQFIETKFFAIEKTDDLRSPFGNYIVRNPETKNAYKVAFRGLNSPMNFCSCMDFKTNRLGTCKHLEALVFQLNNNPATPNIDEEYVPDYTSVYLSYKNGREVKIRIGYDYQTEIAAKYNVNETFADLMNAKLFPYQQEGIRFAFEKEMAQKEAVEPLIFGDDDFKPSDDQTFSTPEESQPKTGKQTRSDEASELLAQGFSFLSGLANALSTKDGVEQLAHSLVEKDEKTGKTHLKIPVESEETVSNVLNIYG